MRKLLSSAVLLLLCSPAYASNEDTNTASVTGYVAAPIVITKTSDMQFPDVVRPVTGFATVDVSAAGAVTYGALDSPAGGTLAQSNANGNNRHQIGDAAPATFDVTGEANYRYGYTAVASAVPAVPAGVTLNVTSSGNSFIGIGPLTIDGDLIIGPTAPLGNLDLAIDVTVSYN